jgi:high-affinity K+ transport system ATPase subunit B
MIGNPRPAGGKIRRRGVNPIALLVLLVAIGLIVAAVAISFSSFAEHWQAIGR